MYGVGYGMKKTTIYLPDELKAEVERLASERHCTEAEIIRDAVASIVASSRPPAPTIPLFADELSDPTIAERVDELLDGFGQ